MAEAACVFDRIRDGQVPAHVVLDDDDLLAFLDHRPLFPGHTLVIPKQHFATLRELDELLAARLFTYGRRIAMAMRPALGAEGTFIALNDEVSQSVPHVHLHVVPRRRRDGLRGFFWPRHRYRSPEEAERAADALRSALAAPSPSPEG